MDLGDEEKTNQRTPKVLGINHLPIKDTVVHGSKSN